MSLIKKLDGKYKKMNDIFRGLCNSVHIEYLNK